MWQFGSCAWDLLKEVPLSELPPPQFGLRSNREGREHSPTHQQKIGLKIYWAWPHPSEQDSVSLTVSLYHQEASIRLLYFPSEGRQNENAKHRKLIKLIAQLCLTFCDPLDCSPPGSSVHGILQARILEWVAISFSRGSSRPRDRTWVSCITGRCFTLWASTEAQHGPQPYLTQWNYE